jgi:hypothetical protein
LSIRKHIKLGASAYIALAVTGIILLIIIIGFPNKYNWETGKTNFSVFYSSIGTMVQGEINIKISENGEYEFIEYAGTANESNRKVIQKYSCNLTNSEMEELFNYMMNKVDFFKIKENISKDRVTDASYDYLEVEFNGNSHRIGGYAASLDKIFMVANKKLREIKNVTNLQLAPQPHTNELENDDKVSEVDWKTKYKVINKVKFHVLINEYLDSNDKENPHLFLLVRDYWCFDGTGEFSQVHPVTNKIAFDKSNEIKSALDFKKHIVKLNSNSNSLRLMENTIISDTVLNQWNEQEYDTEYEYSRESPKGLTYEMLEKSNQ